jgi:hypothetical protein
MPERFEMWKRDAGEHLEGAERALFERDMQDAADAVRISHQGAESVECDYAISRKWIAEKGSELLAMGIRHLTRPEITNAEAAQLTAIGSVLSGAMRNGEWELAPPADTDGEEPE